MAGVSHSVKNKRAPSRVGGQGPDVPWANPRPGDPLSGCVVSRARLRFSPAQPTYHGSDARHKYHWTPELCLTNPRPKARRILESDEPHIRLSRRPSIRMKNELVRQKRSCRSGIRGTTLTRHTHIARSAGLRACPPDASRREGMPPTDLPGRPPAEASASHPGPFSRPARSRSRIALRRSASSRSKPRSVGR